VVPFSGGNRPDAHFVMIPPISRLEANKQNALRILRRDEALPTDRESVYWVRVNAIPASNPAATRQAPEEGGMGASMAISLGLAIKLYYRPDGLPMRPEEAYSQLAFKHEGTKWEANNPTPYYLSLAELSVGGKQVDLAKEPYMVPPYGSISWSVPGSQGQAVRWQLINDYGGATETFAADAKS
jgi:P pilus assembly chaperone PapD